MKFKMVNDLYRGDPLHYIKSPKSLEGFRLDNPDSTYSYPRSSRRRNHKEEQKVAESNKHSHTEQLMVWF
jgi:hypothetical protein